MNGADAENAEQLLNHQPGVCQVHDVKTGRFQVAKAVISDRLAGEKRNAEIAVFSTYHVYREVDSRCVLVLVDQHGDLSRHPAADQR